MPKRTLRKLTPAEQRKRFIETARELGIPDTEAARSAPSARWIWEIGC
jgi:hypothetical protein